MWPYNDDEAGWLDPRDRPVRLSRPSANDNDPAPAPRTPSAAETASPDPKPARIRAAPPLE
jgi:hypothetical protein